MNVNVLFVKFTTKVRKKQKMKDTFFQASLNLKFTLKDMKEKGYLFLYSNFYETFDEQWV